MKNLNLNCKGNFTIENGKLKSDTKFMVKEIGKNINIVEQKKNLKEKEYFEYSIEKESLIAINVLQSSQLYIKDLSVLNEHNLNIFITRSGLIETSFFGYFIKNLNLYINKNGDIHINKFQSDNCNCFIVGNGDIFLRESNFNTLNLNITEYGDIKGIRTTAINILENIISSGYISGFRK